MSNYPIPPGAPLHASSPAPPLAPVKTSGLAIAALILGLIPGLGMIGLILGIVALVTIAKPERREGGKGLAWAGIILGGLNVLVSLVLLVVAFMLPLILAPAVGAARGQAQAMAEATNLRMIGTSIQQYAMENNDRLPLHVSATSTARTSPQIFTSPRQSGARALDMPTGPAPTAPVPVPYRVGDFTFTISGGRFSQMRQPSRLILAYGARVPGARARRNVLFVDGHIETLDEAQFARLLADQGPLRAESNLPPLGAESP